MHIVGQKISWRSFVAHRLGMPRCETQKFKTFGKHAHLLTNRELGEKNNITPVHLFNIILLSFAQILKTAAGQGLFFLNFFGLNRTIVH